MLRLKLVMKECGISQQALVKATGWSKALVSRALSGELPKDLKKFQADVFAFVDQQPGIMACMTRHQLAGMDLFDDLADVSALPADPQQPVDLEGAILARVGRAQLYGAEKEHFFALGKCTLHLLEVIRHLPVGMDELADIEMEAGRLLLGGES